MTSDDAGDGVTIEVQQNTDPSDCPGQQGDGSYVDVDTSSPVCVNNGTHACENEAATCQNGEGLVYEATFYNADDEVTGNGQVCVGPGDDIPVVTPGLVASAVARLPFPESVLELDPHTKTLVNLATIISTNADPFTRQLTLLGQGVTVELEPATYTWDHGDGTSQVTDWEGMAWRRAVSADSGRYLTHTYLTAERLSPSVDTTWTARYRVGGGPWLPVPGSVTVDGDPEDLLVLEAPPELHGPE